MKNKKVAMLIGLVGLALIGGIVTMLSLTNNHQKHIKDLSSGVSKTVKSAPLVKSASTQASLAAPAPTTSAPAPQSVPTPPAPQDPDANAQQITYNNADRLGFNRDTQWACMQWLHINTYPDSSIDYIANVLSVFRYKVNSAGHCYKG